MKRAGFTLAALLLAASWGRAALAQSESGQNDANNPLTPKITFNIHDYYVPKLTDVPDEDANQLLFRGLIPHKTFGRGQLLRFTLPLVTTPTASGHATAFGDLTLMDIIPFKSGKMELGVGPLLVAPIAGKHVTGSGKWQAGAVGLLIAPQKWGLIGSLVTYQHSFAGDEDRPETSLMTFQPLLIYNLPKGFYMRSTGTWTFDLEKAGDYIPLGLGVGKVWQVGKTTINGFVEPQYSVWTNGAGTPQWQIFVGLNFQFALAAK